MGGPIRWIDAKLLDVRDVAPDIRLLDIEPSGAFVAPTPGSHINVAVDIDGRPDVRSYSIVGAGENGRYLIAVKRLAVSRGGSAFMWRLTPGVRLSISTPGNFFELRLGRPAYLLVAGGIGITPIVSMARALARAGADVRVLYACRSEGEPAFAAALRGEIGDRLRLFLSAKGEHIDFAREIAALHPEGELYLCGPLRMMDAARAAWHAAGRPMDRLRFETFGNSGRFPSVPFEIAIPRLGRTIRVAQNQTMLEALESAGVEMIFDCRRGECGLCALDVLAVDGTLDHRDVFFSEAEKAEAGKICTCVSRVAGRGITLDTPDRV
jgi:vanillate O-demethylase ferredoxin subunit